VSISGTHAPGNPLGTQTFTGPLSYAATARLKWVLLTNTNAAGSAAQVSGGDVSVANGAGIDLVLNGAGSTVNYYSTFWTQSRSWTVLGATTMSGTFILSSTTADSTGRAASTCGAFSLVQSATGAVLVWTPKAFTAWRGTAFGANAGNTAISDFTANPDNDGLANAWEYLFSTDPNVSGTSPALPQQIGNRLALAFPRNTAATDVTATVQAADSLSGPWTDLASSTNGGAFTVITPGATANESGSGSIRTVEVRDLYDITDPSHPKRFLRLKIQ
jgi:hypothetical protein